MCGLASLPAAVVPAAVAVVRDPPDGLVLTLLKKVDQLLLLLGHLLSLEASLKGRKKKSY